MTAPDALAERYGTPSPWRRHLLVTTSVALAAAFVGWLAWTALSHAEPEVSSALVAYDIVDEHTATARVEVEVSGDGVVATCVLRAVAEDHTVVGEASFEVTGDDGASGTRTFEPEVRTERRATSVELIGCTTPGQLRPR